MIATLERHAELDSTNNRAAVLAEERGARLPALIVAERQTSGRGRGENRWWSSAGALTFSLLIEAEERLPAARRPLVSLAAALAIGDAVSELLPQQDVRLKWPNDVFVGGKKICGILVEAPPVRPPRLIIGIGLNVNNSVIHAPEEVRGKATALLDEARRPFDLDHVLDRVAHGVLDAVDQLAAHELELAAQWSPRCFLTGKHVLIEAAGRQVAGDCGGIDHDGALLVATERGIERLYAGAVTAWQ
jgi:BirA family biotin operon repressor/biotin-[acetyl-CoA-carboxylase] ligase